MFSHRVQELLTDAGWTPNRRVSLEPFRIPRLVEIGFTPSQEALQILESLGGLQITVPKEHFAFPAIRLTLDPIVFAEFDRVQPLQEHLRITVFPIGVVDGPSMFLSGSDGKFYDAGPCGGSYLVGASFEEALEEILFEPSRYVPVGPWG